MNNRLLTFLLVGATCCGYATSAVAQCPNPRQGPDIIVGDLIDIGYYGRVPMGQNDGISAYAVGTTSCNMGNQDADWIANTNRHPVIGQNMYRLKNGRFEMIGMSWLKHGFTALTQNLCCTCNGHGGPVLGVGCSDPYVSSLNGDQGGLGPRSTVNATTGVFFYDSSQNPPFGGQNCSGGDIICKRLQVHDADLEPSLNAGAQYLVEGQYIAQDDAAAGNGTNNASYRRVNVTEPSSNVFNVAFCSGCATQREKCAIEAWRDLDPAVTLTAVDIPNGGRVWVAYKVTNMGGGVYHYEYAIQNLNSDRSVGGVSIPAAGAVVQNIGFHDVPYHSNEPYPGTDWVSSFSGGAVTWNTQSFAQNQNANALRWGTLYNFRFDATTAPVSSTATLTLFKPGSPTTVSFTALSPAPADCNTNGVLDSIDIGNGTSPDCNTNFSPDECDVPGNDCNANGIPDGCEGTDCNTDGARDFCQMAGNDCNNNGQLDVCDLLTQDCNTDAIVDGCQLAGRDCDANGQLDPCQPDCDLDGVPNTCELANNDCNNNNLPDNCDTSSSGGPATYPAGVVNRAILDNSPLTPTLSTLTVPAARGGAVLDLDVHVQINHTHLSDLRIELQHFDGVTTRTQRLWERRCSSFDNMNCTFDDAGVFVQCSNGMSGRYTTSSTGGSPLANYNGMNAAGTWTLRVYDMAAGDAGTLVTWNLHLVTPIVPPTSQDSNGNQIPDECECGGCLGDTNLDARVDSQDIQSFVSTYIDNTYNACADMDGNGQLNAADVSAFSVKLLTVAGNCQ